MPLAMARPWKHPNSGIYWLRKGVPKDLRVVVGKREEKRSLGTRDPDEARRRHAEALAELEKRWANLRAGQRSLTERAAHELATPAYDRWLEIHRDNPSEQVFWHTELADKLWTPLPRRTVPIEELWKLDRTFGKIARLEEWCLEQADDCLRTHGLMVDEGSRLKLAKAIAAAVQRASLTLARHARGEFDEHAGSPSRQRAEAGTPISTSDDVRPVGFGALVTGWASEKRPAEKTLYEWSRVIRQLVTFLGHDDARRLSADDLIAWKAALVEAGLRPKTIRDAKLAPVRAILRWAVDNRRLPSNPAERIMIGVKLRPGEAKRGFTDEEAAVVLRAAAQERDPVRRWVPWLCAYSGARVSEVCQLRAEDVVQVEGIWCIKFDPEAGPLKNRNSERAVPLHPALIESGFLAFAGGIKSGPLFPGLPPDKFGKRGGNGTKVLGRWVRSLGLTDPRLSPNHSWRHRLKTLGRRHGLAPDLVDAITGHRRKTVADTYGEFPMAALQRELSKIPDIVRGASAN
jgi:integrase